ncbi:MAG: hypothetical protein WCP16_18335 [Pseudanabaena sp. ELA645]|jgi:hypothetical protein
MVLDSRSRVDSSESIFNSNGADPSSNGNYAPPEPINNPIKKALLGLRG